MTSTGPDIERVWTAMLDDTAPPLPTARDALATARRAARRRTAFAFAGSGLAGVVIVASVSMAIALVGSGVAAPTGPAPVAVPPAPQQPAEEPLLPLLRAPDRETAHEHGPENAAILLAAVPAGLTGVVHNSSGGGSPAATWQVEYTEEYSSTVYVVLTTGSADGLIDVALRGGLRHPVTDLCSASLTLQALWKDPGSCDTVVVDGVLIRLASYHDEDYGDTAEAVRLLDGGFVTVRATQGIPVHHGDGHLPPDAVARVDRGEHSILGGYPALPAVPFTPMQLAAIAANPALVS